MSVNEKKNEEYNEKKKKGILLIILIVLIFLFFIILYFLGFKLGKIDIVPTFIGTSDKYNNDENRITENINLLEKSNNKENTEQTIINNIINNSKRKNEDEVSKNEINSSKENNPQEIIRPEEQKIDILEITEDDLEWNVQGNLNIFSNPQFNHKLMIAPGSEHYYQFIVENKTNSPIKYNMVFTDTNDDNINLKYKLKLDNSYIVGRNNWASVSELDLSNVTLAGNSKNLYMIEWKWIEGTEEQDTLLAGKSYELFINVTITENL